MWVNEQYFTSCKCCLSQICPIAGSFCRYAMCYGLGALPCYCALPFNGWQLSIWKLTTSKVRGGAWQQGGHTLWSTIASATADDSAEEPPTQAAPTAKPSAAECTSSPTNARLAPSILPCKSQKSLSRDNELVVSRLGPILYMSRCVPKQRLLASASTPTCSLSRKTII